ncbi:MAG: homoserine kinase [Nocardioidaceae bacterium]
MADLAARPVTVRAPATSANLGPGFDSFGLCLSLFDTVTAEAGGTGLEIDVRGEGAGVVPVDLAHLVARAMHATFEQVGVLPPPLRLTCLNKVPHRRGLGSSAAAIVAGVLAANALCRDAGLDAEQVLDLAARLEGHGDNVAACLLGGFTISWVESGRTRAVRLDVHPQVRPVAFVPPGQMCTDLARGLLPSQVSHSRASANVARAGLLVEALSRSPEWLLAATEDFLHQEYRAAKMPESARLVADLRASGVPALVSGAGPSVIAFGTPLLELHADQWLPSGWSRVRLGVEPIGATVVAGRE